MKEKDAPVGSRILVWNDARCLRTRHCSPIEVTVLAWSKSGMVKILHDGHKCGSWWNAENTAEAEVAEVLTPPKPKRRGRK